MSAAFVVFIFLFSSYPVNHIDRLGCDYATTLQELQAFLLDSINMLDSGLDIGTSKAMEAGIYCSGLIDDVRIYNRAVIP